jgi:hypothetical protein
LEEIWQEVKPDYLAELARYDFSRMSSDVDRMWAYLRMKRVNQGMVVSVPDLINRHNQATGSRFDNIFYSVEGPGSSDYGLNTHEYLHPVTRPFVEAAVQGFEVKLALYFRASKDTPAVKTYGTLVSFVDECLVHALDERIAIKVSDRDSTRRWAESDNSAATKSGLILTEPFYRLLADYEKSNISFSEYLPVLIEKLPDYAQAQPLKTGSSK